MPPLVFLSHSGADTEAARELKRLLLASPDAQKAGLRVWFDKDDLRPGTSWSAQIADVIQNRATAFVVHVGAGGVMNWVEAEVELALSRATTRAPAPLLFIPALAPESAGSKALPPFAKRYQSVRDPLGDGEERTKLLRAVLDAAWDAPVRLIDEPFVGLRAMREAESDRFFGRDAEVAELAGMVKAHRIVAIVADSGTGKSSLAAAGLAPRFRGGALADVSRGEPDERVWHVVVMRPGANPEDGLRTGVTEAAEKLGRSGAERADLRRRLALDDPGETAFALQCDLPATATATLLIVDQFEECLTQTPGPLAARFVRLLLALADSDKDIRILLTVRADYFNLASAVAGADGEAVRGAGGKTLFERLTENGRAATLALKRMSDAGLADAVEKPLRLAGETNEAALAALVKAVRRDVSDQPGDLPLMQVALRAAWREHRAAGMGLVEAYESVGGVLGALAREAEAARLRLAPDDQARLVSVFVRLVRLGDTGGATRRAAELEEFDAARRELLQRLARDDFGRLVVVTVRSAEIAHEALITQWPWLAARLDEDALDVRRLDRLMEKAREWRAAPGEQPSYLSTGAERQVFSDLAVRRPDWLSEPEDAFVAASDRAFLDEVNARETEQARKLADARKLAESERRIAQRTRIGLGAALMLLIVVIGLAFAFSRAADSATRAAALAATAERNATKQEKRRWRICPSR